MAQEKKPKPIKLTREQFCGLVEAAGADCPQWASAIWWELRKRARRQSRDHIEISARETNQ